ncbi:hypothetical protein [Prevotellamassilia timonensis]|uniref:hypothetical protein n=1 Tax=Prevotellamassilia timonensis TaxID=1852370 RepID=UPI003FD6D8A4
MINENSHIPAEVVRYQNENGCNTSELVASNARGDIYALSCIDSDGMPVPIGLPLFVIVKNGKSILVAGSEAFKLSHTLFTDK